MCSFIFFNSGGGGVFDYDFKDISSPRKISHGSGKMGCGWKSEKTDNHLLSDWEMPVLHFKLKSRKRFISGSMYFATIFFNLSLSLFLNRLNDCPSSNISIIKFRIYIISEYDRKCSCCSQNADVSCFRGKENQISNVSMWCCYTLLLQIKLGVGLLSFEFS